MAYKTQPIGRQAARQPPWQTQPAPKRGADKGKHHYTPKDRPPSRKPYQHSADRPAASSQPPSNHYAKLAREQQDKLLHDTMPLRLAEAQEKDEWEVPPRSSDVLPTWRKAQEKHLTSLAATAARQEREGGNTNETIQQMKLTKAKILHRYPLHQQKSAIRDHLNSAEDELREVATEADAANACLPRSVQSTSSSPTSCTT